jgi:flagellin
MNVAFNDVRANQATGLNLTTWVAGTAVQDLASANSRITEIDAAITTLNTRRADLGAAQNRLEHTIASLGVSVENLTAAESRIRDADVAELSSQMVSNQILSQAGTAVLSQANQASQSVLSLLR